MSIQLPQGRRYRYYISQSLTADPKDASSNGWRLPGQEIEQVIAQVALEILLDDVAISNALQESGIAAHYIPSALNAVKEIQPNTTDLIDRFVQRAELSRDGIRFTLSLAPLLTEIDKVISIVHDIPIFAPISGSMTWHPEEFAITEIASKEGVDKSYVSRVISLAFLAPDVTESIIAGRQPDDLSAEKLIKRIHLPLDWWQQHKLLGFD
jgi:site-specific DNA recombinase